MTNGCKRSEELVKLIMDALAYRALGLPRTVRMLTRKARRMRGCRTGEPHPERAAPHG